MIHYSVLVCDDVRQEVGNKFSVMGIYGDSLNLVQFPCDIEKLGFQVTLSGEGKFPQEIRLVVERIGGEGEKAELQANLQGPSFDGWASINLPPVFFGKMLFEEEGSFKITLWSDNEIVYDRHFPVVVGLSQVVEDEELT